jgi:hypothetical protein
VINLYVELCTVFVMFCTTVFAAQWKPEKTIHTRVTCCNVVQMSIDVRYTNGWRYDKNIEYGAAVFRLIFHFVLL